MDPFERLMAEVERMASVLEPQAKNLFAFLRRDGGFTERPSTRRQPPLWTQFIYRNATLGIEVQLNYSHRLVAVWLVRLDQGKYPTYARLVDGVLIRPRLEQVLHDQLHITDPIIGEVERLRHDSELAERDEAFLERMLGLYHDLLRRHLATILQQPLAALFPTGIVSQHMYQTEVKRKLEQQARERFGFLRDAYGFTADLLEDVWFWGTSISFRNPDIGVRISFEYRDCDIDVYLVKLSDGEPPDMLSLQWDRGVRVSAPLERVIEDYLGEPDPLIGEIRRAFGSTDLDERDLAFGSAVLAMYERLLRAHIDVILQQPLDVIFPHEEPIWGVKDLDWR
jgi:hypothetical protein